MTIAWFTSNKEVSESGLQMTAGGIPFTIEFPGKDEGHWINQYHNLSNQTGIWLVDDDKNMDNGSDTTEEKLGFTGEGLGISAQAVCILETVNNFDYRMSFDASENAMPGCAGCNVCPMRAE